MDKSVLDKKWKCYRPKGSNGFWYVTTLTDKSVCTCYDTPDADKHAKQIVKDHNEQLKVKKALKNTPFKDK